MFREHLSDLVLKEITAILGPHTDQTVYVRRWDDERKTPINVERRGYHFVNVWLRRIALNSQIPSFAELYPMDRSRNSNLSPRLKRGNEVLRLHVTRKNLPAVCLLIRSAFSPAAGMYRMTKSPAPISTTMPIVGGNFRCTR